jgi:hypothetical protein
MSAANALQAVPAPNEVNPVKIKRVPKRIAEVVHLLVTGECKTIKAAAERTGMHPNYLSGALKKPEIRMFADRAARESIAAGTMRASARLIELLDAGSEHVSLDASKHMLAIAGIKPSADPQVSVNIDIKAGYVIDLSDAPKQPVGPILNGNDT